MDANVLYGGPYGTTSGNRYFDRYSIFVGNLPEAVTDEEVKEVFDQYGSTISVQVFRKPYRHRKRVFAFVKYQNDFEASNAIEREVFIMIMIM